MPYDVFRQSFIRYFGYSQEIAKDISVLAPNLATPKAMKYSYQAVLVYVVADVLDKSFKKLSKDGRPTRIIIAAGDAVIWQSLASITLPTLVLGQIRSFTAQQLHTNPYATKHVPPHLRGVVTAGISLLSMPIIVTPIDFGVNCLMNMTYRLIFGY